jgi:hypothetical protein
VAVLIHAAVLVLGAAVVFVTWQSIIVTIILPRRTRNWIAALGWIATYRVIVGAARRMTDPAARDRLLALLGPLNLVGLLFTWMALFALGFACVIFGATDASFTDALDLAGSSIFTLGFATGKTGFSHFLMDVAAASGMIVVGLQIGYLPTIYSAYSQRESFVTLLTMRAAENGFTTGATILANHPLPRHAALLAALFTSWEGCAAAIVESHTNYPWLVAFRSPRASESWVTSMLAILDAIAILDAAAPSAVGPEAEHCRFACGAALDILSEFLRPRPVRDRANDVPLGRAEFVAALESLEGRIPFERDAESAWEAFRAARVAYEPFALDLAAFMLLPRGGWLRPVAEEAA